MRTWIVRSAVAFVGIVALGAAGPARAQEAGLQSRDLCRFHSVAQVAMSPDGTHIAYAVMNYDRPGRPYPQLWIMDAATGASTRLTTGEAPSSDAVWSPDGQWVAYHGAAGGQVGPDRRPPRRERHHVRRARSRARTRRCRARAPTSPGRPTGPRSPSSRRRPVPRRRPRAATRWCSRGTCGARRPARASSRSTTTAGSTSSSRRWRTKDGPPAHERRATTSTRSPGRPTARRSCSARIARRTPTSSSTTTSTPSPGDGRHPRAHHDRDDAVRPGVVARRPLDRLPWHDPRPHGSRDDDGGHARLGDGCRRRSTAGRSAGWLTTGRGRPLWAPDGKSLYFTVQDRGSVHLERLPVDGGPPEVVVEATRAASARSRWRNPGALACAFTSPHDMAELFVRAGASTKQATELNADVLRRARRSRGDVVRVRQQRQPVHRRGVPRAAGRPEAGFEGEAPAGGEHPRRAARAERARVQLPRPGLRRARLGGAARELPRLDRLRPEVRRRRLRRPERQRGAGRAVRRERGHPAVPAGSIPRRWGSRASATAGSSATG